MMLSIVLMASCEKEVGWGYALEFDKQSSGLSVPKEGGTYRFKALNLPESESYPSTHTHYVHWAVSYIVIRGNDNIEKAFSNDAWYRNPDKWESTIEDIAKFNPFDTEYANVKIIYPFESEDGEDYVEVVIKPNTTGEDYVINVELDVCNPHCRGIVSFKVAGK